MRRIARTRIVRIAFRKVRTPSLRKGQARVKSPEAVQRAIMRWMAARGLEQAAPRNTSALE
jgi:hypothetical protein